MSTNPKRLELLRDRYSFIRSGQTTHKDRETGKCLSVNELANRFSVPIDVAAVYSRNTCTAIVLVGNQLNAMA